MTILSNYIATRTDAQRADLRKMFAEKGKGYGQELYQRDRHSYHVFRAMYWQLQLYDEKHGIPTEYAVPAKVRPTPPTSSLAPYPGRGRPLSAISEASVETEVSERRGWSNGCADDSTLVDSPTFEEIIKRFPAVPGSC